MKICFETEKNRNNAKKREIFRKKLERLFDFSFRGSILWVLKLNLTTGVDNMSRHPSLKASGKIRKKRNVLKRYERINMLTEDGRWKPGQKVLSGLPKTKPID